MKENQYSLGINFTYPYIMNQKWAPDTPWMRGERSRNDDGQLRQKRSDTHMGTIEQKYDRDFWVRSDMHLGTYLQQNNINSLNDLMNGK